MKKSELVSRTDDILEAIEVQLTVANRFIRAGEREYAMTAFNEAIGLLRAYHFIMGDEHYFIDGNMGEWTLIL